MAKEGKEIKMEVEGKKSTMEAKEATPQMEQPRISYEELEKIASQQAQYIEQMSKAFNEVNVQRASLIMEAINSEYIPEGDKSTLTAELYKSLRVNNNTEKLSKEDTDKLQ